MSQIYLRSSNSNPSMPNVITLSDNAGTKVDADALGNIQLEGQLNQQVGSFSTTVSTTPAPGSHEIMINPMSGARWIVDGLSTTSHPNGTHTSIASAIASATSGDSILILPKGSPYVEDLTLPAGINLIGMGGDGYDSNVTITGKITYNVGGSAVISNVNLQTNSDYCIVVSGSAASRLVLKDCVISALNHTAIDFTSSNAGALIFAEGCFGTININTATLYDKTSPGTLLFEFCSFANAVSSIASNNSSGTVNWQNCISNVVLTTSSTGVVFIDNCEIDTTALNTTALTTAGTGTSNIYNSYVAAGTASAISVGALTTVACGISAINSSNTNAVTGAGTFAIQGISLLTSILINTTTLTGSVFSSKVFEALDGSQAAPAYAFLNSPGTGMWLRSEDPTPGLSIGVGNGEYIRISNFTVGILAPLLCEGSLNYTNVQSVVGSGAGPVTFNVNGDSHIYISCDPTLGTIIINCPNSTRSGTVFIIKDATGKASTNNITVTTPGGTVTLDGATTFVINVNYGSVSVIFNNTTGNYEII